MDSWALGFLDSWILGVLVSGAWSSTGATKKPRIQESKDPRIQESKSPRFGASIGTLRFPWSVEGPPLSPPYTRSVSSYTRPVPSYAMPEHMMCKCLVAAGCIDARKCGEWLPVQCALYMRCNRLSTASSHASVSLLAISSPCHPHRRRPKC